MARGEDWDSTVAEREPVLTGVGSLRAALLFAAAAVVLALLIIPFAEKASMEMARNGGDLDRMATGSVSSGGSYTIRKSVLQANPNSVCIIRPNGSRSGDC